MADLFDELSGKLAADLGYVQANTLFWTDDTVGEICSVVLAFLDGTSFEVACAVPSGILVRQHLPEKGVPPGLELESAVLRDVAGPLRAVSRSVTGMVLEMGKSRCEIENVGDQLAIRLDGKDVSAGIRARQR
jgi:hypothetical protein